MQLAAAHVLPVAARAVGVAAPGASPARDDEVAGAARLRREARRVQPPGVDPAPRAADVQGADLAEVDAHVPAAGLRADGARRERADGVCEVPRVGVRAKRDLPRVAVRVEHAAELHHELTDQRHAARVPRQRRRVVAEEAPRRLIVSSRNVGDEDLGPHVREVFRAEVQEEDLRGVAAVAETGRQQDGVGVVDAERQRSERREPFLCGAVVAVDGFEESAVVVRAVGAAEGADRDVVVEGHRQRRARAARHRQFGASSHSQRRGVHDAGAQRRRLVADAMALETTRQPDLRLVHQHGHDVVQVAALGTRTDPLGRLRGRDVVRRSRCRLERHLLDGLGPAPEHLDQAGVVHEGAAVVAPARALRQQHRGPLVRCLLLLVFFETHRIALELRQVRRRCRQQQQQQRREGAGHRLW
mmetsp:Transcript_26218/g.80658  ORF Transcript_26218/g.80658 Transcript_26218/m.80658 type:complete len:415 (-) Transcript_26218:30-1274(-)